MSTEVQLVAGLAGAIGSDYRPTHSQLVFVEYGGQASRFNLFPGGDGRKPGTATPQGHLDVRSRCRRRRRTGAKRRHLWDQQTHVLRQMVPQNSAKIINLGVVDFNTITANGFARI